MPILTAPARASGTHTTQGSRWRSRVVAAVASALIATSALAVAPAAHASPGAAETINAMAPLFIHDYLSSGPQWKSFLSQLSTFKTMGGDAIAVDVWWGEVQRSTPDAYDWSYYDRVFTAITDAGLDIVPVMSFHQCGGGVGDVGDCSTPIPIPDFVWQNVTRCGILSCIDVPADDWYVSEYGNQSKVAVSPWGPGTERAYGYMRAFMSEFQNHFSAPGNDYRSRIQELSISTGPEGELRYPSYDGQDDGVAGKPGAFPNRGTFQSYTVSAIESFRDYVLGKYGSESRAAAAWGMPGLTRSMISPPTDHERFITSGAYYNTVYGRDFTSWYNESLVNHGRSILQAAVGAFSGAFSSIPLGVKTAGVHWQTMSGAPYLRAPEVAAGLINTAGTYDSSLSAYGYEAMLTMIKDVQTHGDGTAAPKHTVILHYTSLEKPNLEWDGTAHAYSAAADQVGWIADGAAKVGITLKGENALAGGLWSDGDASNPGWSHIRAAFDRDSVRRFRGLTVLRLSEVTSGGTAQSEMTSFIHNYG